MRHWCFASVKAGTDTHLWSETYDRKMDDIFKIQDEIAGEVVKELKVKLLGAGPLSHRFARQRISR